MFFSKKIYIDVFKSAVIFCIIDDKNDLLGLYNKINIIRDDNLFEDKQKYGVTIYHSLLIIIVRRSVLSVLLIAHEVIHAVNYILIERKGLTYTDSSEEAFTYLTDYVIGKIIKSLLLDDKELLRNSIK